MPISEIKTKPTSSEFTLVDMALDRPPYDRGTLETILRGDRNTLINVDRYNQEGKKHSYTERDIRLIQARIKVVEEMLKNK